MRVDSIVTSRRMPTHCPPWHDQRRWAWEAREWTGDSRHNPQVHDDLLEAEPALAAWLDESISAIRSMPSIGNAQVPDPKDSQQTLDVGFLDPSTVYVLIAHAELRGAIAAGLYVGLVAQDLDCSWRGLSGFYLPQCPGCDPEGRRAVAGVESHMAALGLDLVSEDGLPLGLHSGPDWFEGRLLGGAAVSPRPGLSPTWECAEGEVRGPALIRFGPAITSLTNVVVVDGPGDGLHELAALTIRRVWTSRSGTLQALRTLAASGDVRVRAGTLRRRSRPPIGWTAYRVLTERGDMRSSGLTHSLEHSLNELPLRDGHVVEHVTLAGEGAPEWAQIADLPSCLGGTPPRY